MEGPSVSGNASREAAAETETPEESILPGPSAETMETTEPSSEEAEEEPLGPELSNSHEAPSESAGPSEPLEETGPQEKELTEEGAAPEQEPSVDGIMQPPAAALFASVENPPPEPDTVSTGEELLEWLEDHEKSDGVVKLTEDVYFDDLLYMNHSANDITIDTGEFAIISRGEVYFWHSGLTVRGRGGERGVLRAAGGSALSIGYMTVEAQEGFAVCQEEGGGLVITQCSLDEDAVRYAETPFVWEWRDSVAVVEPGQTAADVLPGTVTSYDVNRFGQMSTEEVAVVWELAGYEANQERRLRFEAAGSTPGFACLNEPVCTIAYNDFPLTFTWIEAEETDRKYTIRGDFTKPEGRLSIDVTVEYSFDGEDWRPYETYTADEDSTFQISMQKGEGEHHWDVEKNAWLWLRVHWDDGGTHYYSNMLRFSGGDFGRGEDHGGNRGGGTDIVDPSGPPEPDPEPEAAKEEADPSEGTESQTAPSGTAKQESASPPAASQPETTPQPETPAPASSQPWHGGADHEAGGSKKGKNAPPEGAGDGQGDEEEASYHIPLKPALSGGLSDSAGGQTSSAAVSAPGSAQEPVKGPDALSIAAGLGAVSISIGGAALYLHPKVWSWICRKLRGFIRR